MRSLALVLTIGVAGSVWAQDGPLFVEDEGHVAVFEHDGSNYDKRTPAGDANAAPRQAILRKFLETHGDFYDFVVIFTNFEFDRGEATAFYLGVRNDVRGIGGSLFDHGGSFGSPKRLQGVIDMGPIGQYRKEPLSVEISNPGFRTTLGTLAHEVGHRWLARARYLDLDLKGDLLGEAGIHWSYLLSSDASFMYGSQWEPVGGGLYRATEVQARFSPLDLYLMGFLDPEEVPPLVLLRNPDVDPMALPSLGAELRATEEIVTIEQILAAEGARDPSLSASQRNFRLGFVFLSEKDVVAAPLDLEAVDRIRTAFVTTFFSLTRGRGFVDTDLLNVIPPDPTATPDTTLALTWLLSRQRGDGHFEDDRRTSLRDTTVALETLDLLGVRGEPLAQGQAWLAAQNPSSVDALARAIAAGSPHPVSLLLGSQNLDGGWGTASGYRSDPLDTALTLLALTGEENGKAEDFLVRSQSAEGGWSSIPGSLPDLLATCSAARALPQGEAVQSALAWLVARQRSDGGFGDGPSTPYGTACAVELLLEGGAPATSVDRALDYLRKTQRSEGSWEQSVFQTASVLRALVPASFASLSIAPSEVEIDPAIPEVGERVTVTVTVRNRSRVSAGSFLLEIFDGDPELGGIGIGSSLVASLGPGGSSTASFSWDTTGLEGQHLLSAVADMAGAVSELNKDDNLATREVEVLPPLPNLAIESLVSDPTSPIEGVAASVTARVQNRGSAGAPASSLRLYEGHPLLGLVAGEVSTPALASGESIDLGLSWETTGKLGRRRLVAVVDPEKTLRERLESDNEISLDIDVRTPPPPEPDLVLEDEDLDLVPKGLSTLPQDVTLTARIHNTGANPVPATLVEIYQGNPAAGGILLQSQIVAVPGDGSTNATFTLPITTGGSRTFFAVVDGNEAVVERDETNNVASVDLVDPMDTIDVALVPGTLVLSSSSLTAGETLLVEAEVINRGTRRLTAAGVSLFFEDGASFQPASTRSIDLAPGATSRVALSWKANRLGTIALEVRADPDGRLFELDETNNLLTASVDVAPSTLANLTVSSADVEVQPASPVEGQPATISARVRNVSGVDAGAFDVSFFGGDPDKDGLRLGTVSVPALSASSDVVVSASWSDVNLRGTTLLYVVADESGAVEEFDEEDNRAFRVVDIVGLSDLTANSAALRLAPPFARSGDAVTVEAVFTNAGEQEASHFVAEVRLDDPLTGTLLASETFGLVGGGQVVSFEASWDTAGIEGEHALYLALDVLGGVREQREDNNVVRLPVALQDADLFVTPLYFSPDGNGVQDEAAFFYRTDAALLSVDVVDSEGALVRVLSNGPPAVGSAVWDGRNDLGSLARDGDYFFVLSSEAGEVARRRVVLDTNRSSIVEALGSKFVGFTNLTCPLPPRFFGGGPAFLPDDSAAYFIVDSKDSAAPDYPEGLYRVSVDGSLPEPIATGSEFLNLSFFEVLTNDGDRRFSQAQRIVSPDGLKALATNDFGNLQILDLGTGALTPLFRFVSDARWSPDGKRLLVADFDGVYLYSPNGDLVSTLVAPGAEMAAWSPDGSRIAYRPWQERVLHVMNADGTNDRALPVTDPTTLIVIDEPLTPGGLTLDELFWTRDGEGLFFRWTHIDTEEGTGPVEMDLLTESLTRIPPFGELSSDQRWAVDIFKSTSIRRFRGRELRPVISPAAGFELGWSYRDTFLSYTARTEPGCVGDNVYIVRSLLNGEAQFRLTPLPSGFGVKITGTVADENLDFYRLDYAPIETPDALLPIQAPSDTPVVNDTLTTWLPPGPGEYLVRLTLRDRAGNEVVRLDRVSWSETLPIAGLRRSPPQISPNGDGEKDEILVEYTVLDLVNLVFHVRDEDGTIVRTIFRDEAALGAVSFTWDGTDDGGSRVPDGRYVLEVSGAEIPVLVDATAPEVEASYSALYTFEEEGHLVVDLEGLVQDENLLDWALVTSDGETLRSGHRPVGEGTEPAILLEATEPIQGLEIRASDLAGNVTAVPLVGPSREIRVIGYSFRDKGFLVGPLAPGLREPVPPLLVPPASDFGWGAEASFAPNERRFLYRAEDDDTFTEIETQGGVRFHARDFPLGRRFTGHFEADDLSSQEVSFTVGPDAIFVEASLGPPSLIRLTHTIGEELAEGTLFMTIGAEKRILRTYRPVPRFDELSLPPIPCGATAGFHVEARGLSGKEYHSTTHDSYPVPAFALVFIPGCLSVDDVGIQGQSSPEAEIPSTAVALLFHDLAEKPESVALLLGSEVARVAPDSTQSKATFDVSALAEGSYRLSTRAELPGGAIEEGDYDLSFFLDQTPPSTAILLPVEGGNACVVRESDAEWVELEIAGEDELLIGADVELQTTSGAWERVRTMAIGAPLGFPTSKFQKRLLAEIPTGHEGNLSLRLVVSARRILSEAGGRPSPMPGKPPPWPFPDNNGSILGVASRNVFIVRQQALGNVVIDPALLSPNGDGILDVTHVRGELLEAASLTVRVVRGSVPVRTLVDGVAFGEGPIDAVWDGRDDLGEVVPDGEYRVEVVAVSGCGASSKGEARVEVDTTPPEVAISSPTLQKPVSITVEVRGTAKDQKFLSYQLEFGEGPSPLAFNPIGAPVEHQVGGEKLGDWKVGELAEGLYTLRLTAKDRAGNESSTSVVVEVRSPDLVTSFTGEPLTFSPNGDGVKDRTELSFLLKSDALATLEIRRPNETVVTTLVSGESLPSGTHSVSWDGSAPDGGYIAHLIAADPILPGVTEEARLALVVDTSPPALDVSAPLPDAFVFLPGNVLGSIEDPNLERYTLDLGPEEGALARLAEDSLSVSGVLASLLGLRDGGYRLELHATDLAGNAADAALRFDIDSTPPAVSLREPGDGAQISTAAGSVRVAGRLLETNLQSYALEIGLGAAPSVLAPLAAGFSLPSADVEATWNVSQFPDGTYTLRLRATDKAGSESETSRQVVLDGTQPKVEVAEPSEGDFVTKEDRVLGSATDENFSEAMLSIARGESPLQEIARFDAPVLEGILKDGLPLEDGAYTLLLAAKDLAGNESTVPRSFTLDSAPPAAPQGLQATVRDRDDVRLSWTPNGESDLAGYRVFRDGVLLTAEPIVLPEHFDPDRPEGRFRYTVVAVDRAGLQSEPSAPAEARIDLTPPDVVLRSPEEGAGVRGLVDVVGTAFSENDFHEYRLSVAPEATPASPTLLKRSPLPVSFGTLSQWEAVTLEGGFIFTLEGEDTSGNVAVDTLRVVIDNVAPAPPVLTSVQGAASPDDVEVVWQVSPDADVSGYLVFRNGKIANAPGVVSGDLRPFLVPPPSYVDTGLPDGRFCYRLVAMDEAGNLSGDSNEICIFLDNRTPQAVIVEPENGARFDAPRTARAVSEDEDVASVLFQFQESSSTFWADIALDTEAPYEVLWNVSGLAFGDYRLRAVATDSGSRVDPFPAFIDVVLGDSTPPATPGNLAARVDGSAVTLTWDAVTASDLAGYRVYRDDSLIRELGTETTTTDASRPDGVYEYQVSAFDADGNESAKSEAADASIYAPSLQPAFPIFEGATLELPGEGSAPAAKVELFREGSSTVLVETTADGEGRFLFSSLALPLGESHLEARATDAEGNRSRSSEAAFLLRNEPPAAPSDLTGVATGDTVDLSWTANTESDLSGYAVKREGETVSPDGRIRGGGDVPTTLTASASSRSSDAARAIDGNLSTEWESASTSSFTLAWLEVRMSVGRHLREVRIFWGFNGARDFRVLAEISGQLVPLATVEGNTSDATTHPLPFAVRTARLRVEVTALEHPNSLRVAIEEVELYGAGPLTVTTASDTPDRSGVYDYEVSAIDVFGGVSPPSSVELVVGDVVPPDPPLDLVANVSLADVNLSWTPSPSPDVSEYRVFRDGSSFAVVSGTTHLDAGLPDGIYRYEVSALDFDGNEGAKSNEALAEVSVDSPTAPLLSVSVPPEGKALRLDWTVSSGPLGVAEYAVFRATTSGGPYVEVARSTATSLLDEGLTNGVTYFYVTRALDPRGEASPDSNEASGTPSDLAPPEPPVFLKPTTSGVPVTLGTSRTTLVGRSEPGASVAVFRGAEPIGEVAAASSLLGTLSFPAGVVDSWRMALSSDRTKLAEIGAREIRISDFVTGELGTLAFDTEGERAHGAAFSPKGDRIAVATNSDFGSGSLRILDLEAGSVRVLPFSDEVGWPVWRGDDAIAVADRHEIYLVTPSTDTRERLYQALPFDLRPEFLLFSPEGTRLAFVELSSLKVLDLETRTVATAGNSNPSGFDWISADEVAFTDFEGLHIANVSMGTSALVPGTEGMRSPSRLAHGKVLLLRTENDLAEVFLSAEELEALGELPGASSVVALFAATSDFRALIVDGEDARLKLFSIPGRFELRDVSLLVGPNTFTATAADSEGNTSVPSEPIEVAFDNSALPDIVLEGPMLLVPEAPLTGEIASLSFVARNQGASPSLASVVQVVSMAPTGDLATIGSAALPELPAGGSAAVSLGWETTGFTGAFDLVAIADPLGLVDERDEDNNTLSKSVVVVSTRGIDLGVATSLPSYAANQDVEIRIEAVNGGSGADVAIETSIEDAGGNWIATVDRRSTFLGFGETTSFTVFWNTGRSLAGSYRVRATSGLSTVTDGFEVRRHLDLRARVVSDRPSYRQGDAVLLIAELANVESNASLSNLTLEFLVGDAASNPAFESQAVISYLAIGGEASVSVLWPRALSEPGAYSISLHVLEAGQEIATASGAFEILAATSVELSGSLTLEDSEVPTGGEVVARFTVENVGVVPLAGGVVRVELETLSQEVPAEIAPGETLSGEIRLESTGQTLGRHFVLLSSGAGSLRALANAPVTLFAVPASPSLNAPAEGASVPQPLQLSVNNASNPNRESLTYEFEIYLDDSLRILLGAASSIPEGTNTTLWTAPLNLEENQRYLWRARARDRFATSDWMPPASLFADTVNEPPGPPSLSAPAEATEVDTLLPALSVANAFDPERSALTYTFEIYRDDEMTEAVATVSSIPEGDGTTEVTLLGALSEDTTYFWRARANDGVLDSDWMLLASFRVNTANHPPTKPLVKRPAGTEVATATPELVARGGLDPEGDVVTHRLEVDRSPGFDSAELQSVDGLFAAGDEVQWAPPLPLEENRVYFWRARASDGLATSEWSEVASFRIDIANEAPSVPRAESPLGGAVVPTSTPALVVVNASDPESDALRYDFEVYQDEALTLLDANIDSVREGEVRTAWAVSPRLNEDTPHYWRARASDGNLRSGWSSAEAFFVNATNAAPAAPLPASPLEGGLVSLLPVTLGVVNATDPDLDSLTYRFEVYRDENLSELVEASPSISETSGETSWEMTAALEENRMYFWRARASDGALEGAWMVTARFRFSLTNESPTAPVLLSPEDGAITSEERPLLVVENATDPDGDRLRYVFEVFSDTALSTLVARSPDLEEGPAQTGWRVSRDLSENGTFYWRAVATDGALSRTSDDVFQLRVDGVEERPGAPVPLSPGNGSIVPTRTPTLLVKNSMNPDGRLLHYHFELYELYADVLVASQDDVTEGAGETKWEIPLELTPGQSYSWRSRGIDDRGLTSDWSDLWTFSIETPVSDCPPEWREDFDRFPNGVVPSGWRLRSEIGNPRFEVRSKELVSRFEGRAALLFEGEGESESWRNYEFSGVLELEDEEEPNPPNCGFSAGVLFYGSESGEYRLDVTPPECRHPSARLVKVLPGGEKILAEGEIEDEDEDLRFRIAVTNDVDKTRIVAELRLEDEAWWLEAEDAHAPLRGGTVGAWSNFVEAEWDDFHVREIPGLESGISGDENGDGVCDPGSDSCSDPLEVCLDDGQSVAACSGHCGHSGPTACGRKHSYWVGKKTGVLSVQTPVLEGGRYRFRLLLHQGKRHGAPVVRVEFDSGPSFDVSDDGPREDEPFSWSEPVEVELPGGVTGFRIHSLIHARVHVEAFRLEPVCE